MAKYRHVYTTFWDDPKIMDNFTPEDRYFYLYLLTNPHTSQIGVYKITKKVISFELGYSIESTNSLMDRFIKHHKLIRYNDETRELALKNWGKYNLKSAGKPILDCLRSELQSIEDISLLKYVAMSVPNEAIKTFFEAYAENNSKNVDTCYGTSTAGGQNENENENENENNNSICETDLEIKPVDNVDKKSLSEGEPSDTIKPQVPYKEIIELFNITCKSLPKVKARTKERDKKIKTLWLRCNSDIAKIQQYFSIVEASDFLSGRNGKWTNCCFDWVLKPANYIKVCEGNYLNKKQKSNTSAFCNFQQRDSDEYIDNIERRLLGWD